MLIYSKSLVPVTTKPSRIGDAYASLIDFIWSSQPETNLSNYTIYTDLSNHFPVYSEFNNSINDT